jgi:hypothetical protein
MSITPAVDPALLISARIVTGTGNTTTGSDNAATCVSEGETDITCIAAAIVPESAVTFGAWSCGSGAAGEVICPQGSTPFAAGDGDFLAVAVALAAYIPFGAPAYYYQYGLVFDSDGLPGNNFQPASEYPADFFAGTDLWMELLYTSYWGWQFRVSDIVGNIAIERSSTKTKVLIAGNVVLYLTPVSVFGPNGLASATYRVSAFLHDGTFLAGFWNGDVHPAVADPKLAAPVP